jgi:hypothetical protein
MFKFVLVAAALMIVLPSNSHAMSKKPPPGYQPGGPNRPGSGGGSLPVVSAPTPRPLSPECVSAKAFANGIRDTALASLNQAVKQPKPSQLEINFYNCRQTYAQEAVSVAEISVCGGYLSSAQFKDKAQTNFKICDDQRAAEKLALSQGVSPPKDSLPIILTTPGYKKIPLPVPPVQADTNSNGGGGGSRGGSNAAGAQAIQ